MEIIYRAIDGEEFTNEIDCRAHEEHLQAEKFKSQVHLWDEDKDTVELTGDVISCFDNIMYFRCDTEDAYDAILRILVNEGFAKGLGTYGSNKTWAWSEQETKWFPLTERIAELEEELSILNSMCYLGDDDS